MLDASALQDAEQVLAAADTAVADQWVGQQVDIAQSGSADATSSQGHTKLTGPGTHQAAGRAHADIESDISQHVFQDGLVDGGSNEQWAGQLALVEQVGDATSAVVQTGTAPPRRTGATANASASVHDFALVEQASDQAAARGAGEGSQVVQQLVLVLQDGSAYATTVQQAGASVVPVATSEAQVGNRAAVSQAASQAAVGTSGVDQELVQQSIVVQFGAAVSISNGGIAGTATVFNCAISQQGAVQAIGAAAAPASAVDSSTFCSPAAPQTFAGDAPGPLGDTPAAQSGPVGATVPVTAISTNDEEPMIFRGGRGARGRRAACRRARRARLDRTRRSQWGAARDRVARIERQAFRPALHASALDSRPGSDAGPETPVGSRCFRRREEAHPRGSLRSQPRCRGQGRRGSQRSSSPSCSCHHSCCEREKRRSSGGRRTCSHRSTCRSELLVTPHLTRWARARWATCDFGCDERM